MSLLPILKTIIALDPHFTQAYQLMGGNDPAQDRDEWRRGWQVLAQCIKNNPDDWETYREVATVVRLDRAQAGPGAALRAGGSGARGRRLLAQPDGAALPITGRHGAAARNQTPLKADG